MKLYFITGNEGKFAEVSASVPGLERISLDLPEIQSLDPQEVIAAKLRRARKYNAERAYIVEDTGLHLACLNGFPGPLVKWLLESVGCVGIAGLCQKYDNFEAAAETVIGLRLPDFEEPEFFHGHLKGRIVSMDGSGGFGWDPIFVPEGENQTLASMKSDKPTIPKMRREAAEQLAQFIKERRLPLDKVVPV
jgi:non-canonical purine NTP pyrophosphatase (RdgB/HAM1 family)